MNAAALIGSLERFGRLLPRVVEGVSDDDARWKPPDGAWSVLEVICHLGDEEVDDFRRRIELTLRDPALDWPPIAPEQWAIERRYNERDLREAVEGLVRERVASIEWLRALGEVDWAVTKHHPKLGSLRAGDLLVSWAAHDMLHLRQIAKRLYQIALRDGGEFKSEYAGPWS